MNCWLNKSSCDTQLDAIREDTLNEWKARRSSQGMIPMPRLTGLLVEQMEEGCIVPGSTILAGMVEGIVIRKKIPEW